MLGQLRLPVEKLRRLKESLASWAVRRSCRKRDLLSLIGSSHNAAAVVNPEWVFLRRFINLSKIPKGLHHFVRLTKEAQSDIQWWRTFVDRWNGVGLLSALGRVQPDVCERSDASGLWGCGAVWRHTWLQLQWSEAAIDLRITAKETVPVVLAAFCWGRHGTGKCVLFEVDNSTVALALQSGSCRDPQVMRLLRMLHFVAAEHQFTYTSQHIPGTENCLTDAISRNSVSTAFSVQPLLAHDPCPISSCLSALVQDDNIDWTSAAWTTQFLACLQPV